MGTGVRDKYHVAVNAKGYMLRGAPGKPAYQRSVVPSQVDRLAISDLAYSDFSGAGLFYTAQTDWSSGVKTEKKWRDDGKFYYSENIDAYSDSGEIKIISGLAAETITSPGLILCGYYGNLAGTDYRFIGNFSGTTPRKVMRKSGATWSDITGDAINNNIDAVIQIISHKSSIYILNYDGADTSDVLLQTSDAAPADNTDYTDHTSALKTAMSWATLHAATAAAEVNWELYVALYTSGTPFEIGIAKTADNGSNWSKVLDYDGNHFIIGIVPYGDGFYYLVNSGTGGSLELRFYDVANSADAHVAKIAGGVSLTEYNGNAWMHILNNNQIIITNPEKNSIYEYNISAGTMERIYKRRSGLSDNEVEFRRGGLLHDNKIWWGNLMYDGEAFFHTKMNQDLTADTNPAIPVLSDGSKIYWNSLQAKGELYYDSTYKSGTDANFLILSEISEVSGIEKMLHSIILIFGALVSGQSIKVAYSTNDEVSYTNLDTITPATEGSNTSRTLIAPSNILFTKIFLKIYLNGGGSNTPTIQDIVMVYKPMPDFKNRWAMRLDMGDSVKLLNGQYEQRDGRDLAGRLWNEKIVKQKVLFEDIDYAECSLVSAMTSAATSCLVDTTNRLPNQGRIRAVSGSVAEEMYYTSATPTKILGIARAARGTRARAYISGQTLKNDYNVIVEDIKTGLNFTDEKKTESIAQVMLIEI